MELRVRLKSFFLTCDVCIISLSHEYESFFNIVFFYPFKNRSAFYKSNLIFFTHSKIDMIFIILVSFLFFIFFILQKQIWFLLTHSHFFLPFTKTDLIFKNQISYIYIDLICKNYIYIYIYIFQNRSEFSFKRGHIHKTNSFKLILPSVYHVCYNISFNIIQKGIY